MNRGPRPFDLCEPLAEGHGLDAEHFAVLHAFIITTANFAARLHQQKLAEASRRRTQLVELSLDLQALQLVLVVNLRQVGPIVRIAGRVGDRQDHVLA